MNRAAEFNWLAVNAGRFLLAHDSTRVWWTDDPHQAVRFTTKGREITAERFSRSPYHEVTWRDFYKLSGFNLVMAS